MLDREIRHIVEIAKRHYLIAEGREDLKAKNSDSMDFTDCAVWNIEAALIEAYEMGKAEGAKRNAK